MMGEKEDEDGCADNDGACRCGNDDAVDDDVAAADDDVAAADDDDVAADDAAAADDDDGVCSM